MFIPFNLIPDTSQDIGYLITKNTAFLSDNLFFGSQSGSKYQTFYSIEKNLYTLSNFKVNNSSYFTMYMALDQKEQQYYRSVYSIFDMCAYIGGFFGLFKAIGGVLVRVFEQSAFSCSIFRDLYQIEEKSEANDEHFCEMEEKKERNFRKIHDKSNIRI